MFLLLTSSKVLSLKEQNWNSWNQMTGKRWIEQKIKIPMTCSQNSGWAKKQPATVLWCCRNKLIYYIQTKPSLHPQEMLLLSWWRHWLMVLPFQSVTWCVVENKTTRTESEREKKKQSFNGYVQIALTTSYYKKRRTKTKCGETETL